MTYATSPSTPVDADRFVPAIQGLRAIAVLAVLVYNIWPQLLPGGFVGVDVFFVISGYLITGLLLREFDSSGSISLARFYGRRILRLLPAATIVILAVLFCVSFLPEVRWHDVADDAAASTLYVQNWWLASRAVDYLASEHAASPLQHFWSLSVEEQYYLAWPLLILAAARLLSRRGVSPRILFGGLIGLIFVASLAYSIWLTPRDPGLAYFATTTRAWELALGGLVAIAGLGGRLHRWAGLLAIAGASCMLLSMFVIDVGVPFPGYSALLPTSGAALVLLATRINAESRALRYGFSARPLQYIGDLSYSLYLWHWPVVVFFRSIADRAPDLIDGATIIVISIALAHQTKALVEDRFRFAANLRQGHRAFSLGAAAMVLSLLAAASISYDRFPPRSALQDVVDDSSGMQTGDLAAPAAAIPQPLHIGEIRPSPAQARTDNPDVYREGCHASPLSTKPTTCSWGPADAKVHVVLVGDSHAAQWIPALQHVADANGWRLTSLTKSSCPFAAVTVLDGKTAGPYEACNAWNKAALARILELRPTLVVTSQAVMLTAHGTDSAGASFAALSDGLAVRWRELEQAGIRVAAVKDTPRMGVDVPDCLSSRRGSMLVCGRAKTQVLRTPDPIVLAQKDVPGVLLIDLNDALCPGLVCPPVIDNVLVWRDSHHMTATYARSLAPALAKVLAPFVAAPAPGVAR